MSDDSRVSRSEEFAAGQRRMFHGTHVQLGEGDVLVPGAKQKGAGRRGRSVWLTPSADDARGWAKAGAMRNGHSEPDPNDPTGYANRASIPTYVYEVEPDGLERDRNGYWKAQSARIRRVVD
jgi:hypothetical protein